MSSGLTGSAPRLAIFGRLATASVVALWAGQGNFEAPANDLDVAPQIYVGMGAVTGVPVVQQLLNGVAERISLTLSAIPAEAAAIAAGEAEDVKGAEFSLGVMQLDDDWQPTGDLAWLWTGEADVVRIAKDADAEANQTHTVALSIGTAMTGRRRPDYDTWTDAQQQKAHPGDLFFNQVPASDRTKKWPS